MQSAAGEFCIQQGFDVFDPQMRTMKVFGLLGDSSPVLQPIYVFLFIIAFAESFTQDSSVRLSNLQQATKFEVKFLCRGCTPTTSQCYLCPHPLGATIAATGRETEATQKLRAGPADQTSATESCR